jgi:hypothetical protein
LMMSRNRAWTSGRMVIGLPTNCRRSTTARIIAGPRATLNPWGAR